MKPFSLEFNAAVVTMANKVCPTGYDVADSAPSCLGDLIDHIDRTRRICVARGNSEATIFGAGNEEINWAFRAWHDWTHYHLRANFDLPGEARVAMQQYDDLRKVYGLSFADRYKPLILAEVLGQAIYKELVGAFPGNQREFDVDWLETHRPDYIVRPREEPPGPYLTAGTVRVHAYPVVSPDGKLYKREGPYQAAIRAHENERY